MREQRGRSRYLFIDALIGALIGIASPYGHAQCSNYQITTVDGAKCWPVGYASGGIDISESGVLCGETSNCSDGVIMLWTGGLGYESIVWPPDTQSWAPHGMNSNLVVVGYRVPLNEPEYPFMAINGDVIDLPFLPGDLGGAAHAISQDGRIVGYTGGSALHAVIWIEGEPEPIDLPIGPSSVA